MKQSPPFPHRPANTFRRRQTRMPTLIATTIPTLMAIAWLTVTVPLATAADYKVGDKLAPTAKGTAQGVRQITWDALIPKNWDPYAAFKGLNLSRMQDGDPRAMEAMDKAREAWNQAPVVSELNGATVRIPGFLIPMDKDRDDVRNFLLVPYFGACIHTPPPPANQIIDVRPAAPVKGGRMMDTVWVTGTLRTVRSDSPFGAVGYQIDAQKVEPYEKK